MATIQPNDVDMANTGTLPFSSIPDLDPPLALKKTADRKPRIDVEPLYAAVKGAINDTEWTTYKTSVNQFLLGNLNQEELSFKLAKILTTTALEHAHNSLVAAIYANIWRDAPEAGIASWVSSTDKPSSGTVKGQGDESEKRLKYEVMQLSRRERKRLKTIPTAEAAAAAAAVAGQDGLAASGAMGPALELIEMKRGKQPELGPVGPAGGYKTNWDLEIRKRYTAPLFSETHEFPTPSSIALRLLPSCYEFGLPQGHTPDCPDLMNLATETFIKEALASFLGKVAVNGDGYVRTGAFKKRVEREERAFSTPSSAAAAVVRDPRAELPVEAEERRKRRLLCMEDLRLALQLGDGYLGQTPLLAGEIVGSTYLDVPGIEDIYPGDKYAHFGGGSGKGRRSARNGGRAATGGPAVGVAAATGMDKSGLAKWLDEGVVVDLGGGAVPDSDPDRMHLDTTAADGGDVDMAAWNGGSVGDVDDLDGALDDVLNLGDL